MASKSVDVRPKITMACAECKHRNYITKKNRRNDPDRLGLQKFCPNCGKHTEHRGGRPAARVAYRPLPTPGGGRLHVPPPCEDRASDRTG